MQVEQAYRKLALELFASAALVVGGLSEGPQLQAIRRGARLIVATPGRLEDFLRRKLVQAGSSADPGAGRSRSHAGYGL